MRIHKVQCDACKKQFEMQQNSTNGWDSPINMVVLDAPGQPSEYWDICDITCYILLLKMHIQHLENPRS